MKGTQAHTHTNKRTSQPPRHRKKAQVRLERPGLVVSVKVITELLVPIGEACGKETLRLPILISRGDGCERRGTRSAKHEQGTSVVGYNFLLAPTCDS